MAEVSVRREMDQTTKENKKTVEKKYENYIEKQREVLRVMCHTLR